MITTDTTFTARQVPWMKLGTVIDDPSVTAAQAARLGGLDFEVVLAEAGYRMPDDGHGDRWTSQPTRLAAVREDTGQFFEYVSQTYVPVQYREAFAFMDQIDPRFVAAGTMFGGREGFMVVQFPECLTLDLELGDEVDPHELYAVLRTSHDLSRGIEVSVLALRHKCMNQLGLSSFVTGAVQRWSIRHVGDPMKKLKEAKQSLVRALDYGQAFTATARQLHSVPVSREEAGEILRLVLPARAKREDQVARIQGAFADGPAVGFAGTGYGLVNAVSEYFEWGRPERIRTDRSRFVGALQGDSHRYVNRTAQLVLRRA